MKVATSDEADGTTNVPKGFKTTEDMVDGGGMEVVIKMAEHGSISRLHLTVEHFRTSA